MPFGTSTDEVILGPLGAVVLRQLQAKASGLHPNGRIMLRIEIQRATENLGRDLVFLQRRSRVVQCVFGQISKQFAERFRAMKHRTGYQSLDLPQALLSFDALYPCNMHLTVG